MLHLATAWLGTVPKSGGRPYSDFQFWGSLVNQLVRLSSGRLFKKYP